MDLKHIALMAAIKMKNTLYFQSTNLVYYLLLNFTESI